MPKLRSSSIRYRDDNSRYRRTLCENKIIRPLRSSINRKYRASVSFRTERACRILIRRVDFHPSPAREFEVLAGALKLILISAGPRLARRAAARRGVARAGDSGQGVPLPPAPAAGTASCRLCRAPGSAIPITANHPDVPARSGCTARAQLPILNINARCSSSRPATQAIDAGPSQNLHLMPSAAHLLVL